MAVDRLSIFGNKDTTEVKLTSAGNNTLDNLVDENKDIRRELIMLRKGFEVMEWGEGVLANVDVDQDDIPLKETGDD